MLRILLISLFLFVATHTSAQQSGMDGAMQRYGLVNIADLDTTIRVELKYSTSDNFVGRDMYGDLEDAYFEAAFAQKVVMAQRALHARYPQYNLLIYDAARPISVQRTMRRMVEGTTLEGFVADGSKGGRHNYGVAVDLTIVDDSGVPLDMGTEFDNLTTRAYVKGTPDSSDGSTRTLRVYRAYAEWQVSQGLITRQQADNRLLLIEVMLEAELYPYRREWWHFEELLPMSETRQRYPLLDF